MRRMLSLFYCLVFSISGVFTAVASQTPEVTEHSQLTIGGDAVPLLTAKQGDEVAVVAYRTPDDIVGMLPFVLRNDSDSIASDLMVKVEVTSAEGALLGVGSTTGAGDISPNVLNPDDVALGYIFLEGDFPADANYDFIIQPTGLGLTGFMKDMEFVSADWNGTSVVGEIKNPGGTNLTMVTVLVFCFEEDGTIENFAPDFIMEPIGPNAVVTYQAGTMFYPAPQCDSFLISGSGM